MPVAFPTQRIDKFGHNIPIQFKVPRAEFELIEQISIDMGLTRSAAARMLLREALLAREEA